MKKLHKILAMCLALVMMAVVFGACSAPAAEAPSGSASTEATAPASPSESASDASSGDSAVAAIKAKGELVMLTNAAFPPFEYLGDDQQPAGVDIDVAQAIADELGVELKVVDMEFDGIVPALMAGKGDIGAAGMTVTEERLESVDFSTKYATSSQYMIVKKDSDIATKDDLKGKKIGVQQGTTGDIYATDEDGENGVEAEEVLRYSNAMGAAMALMSDKIDVVIVDELPAKSIVAENDSLKMIDEKLTTEQYAIAVKKDSDLTAEINKVLDKLIADGTIDELILKHTTEE